MLSIQENNNLSFSQSTLLWDINLPIIFKSVQILFMSIYIPYSGYEHFAYEGKSENIFYKTFLSLCLSAKRQGDLIEVGKCNSSIDLWDFNIMDIPICVICLKIRSNP